MMQMLLAGAARVGGVFGRMFGTPAIAGTAETVCTASRHDYPDGTPPGVPDSDMWDISAPGDLRAGRAGWYLISGTCDHPDNTETGIHRASVTVDGVRVARAGYATPTGAQDEPMVRQVATAAWVNEAQAIRITSQRAAGINPEALQSFVGAAFRAAGDDVPGVALRRSASFTTAALTDYSIQFDTVDKATGDTLWTSGSQVVIPPGQAGWYAVSAWCSWQAGTVTGTAVLALNVNGTTTQVGRFGAPCQANAIDLNASALCYLNAGDTVEARVNTAGADTYAAGARMVVFKIPDVTHGAQLERSTNSLGPSSPAQWAIPFTSAVRNDGGMWSASTPTEVTIPVTGWYAVSGFAFYMASSTGVFRAVDIVKNALPNYRAGATMMTISAANTPCPCAGSVLYMSAGDKLLLFANRGFVGNTVGVQRARFQVVRLPDPT